MRSLRPLLHSCVFVLGFTVAEAVYAEGQGAAECALPNENRGWRCVHRGEQPGSVEHIVRFRPSVKCSSSNVTVFMETTFSSAIPVDTDTSTDIAVRMRVEVKSLIKALASITSEPRALNFCTLCARVWRTGFNDVALMIYVIMKNDVGNIIYYIPGQLFEECAVCWRTQWKAETSETL